MAPPLPFNLSLPSRPLRHCLDSPLPPCHPSSPLPKRTASARTPCWPRTSLWPPPRPPCNTGGRMWRPSGTPPRPACASRWPPAGRGPARGCSSSGSTGPSGWCCSGRPRPPPAPAGRRRWTAWQGSRRRTLALQAHPGSCYNAG